MAAYSGYGYVSVLRPSCTKGQPMKSPISFLLLLVFPIIARAQLDERDGKTELMPEFKLVEIVKLDKAKLLGGVEKNYQIKMSDEDWENLPRLIRADFLYLPKSGNHGGAWASHAIYPHRNFSIEFDGRMVTCIGAVSVAMYAGGETKFRTLEQTTRINQIDNIFANPTQGRFSKPSKCSPVFLVSAEAKAFRIYYKGRPIATVGKEEDLPKLQTPPVTADAPPKTETRPSPAPSPAAKTAPSPTPAAAAGDSELKKLQATFQIELKFLNTRWAQSTMRLASQYERALEQREQAALQSGDRELAGKYRSEIERIAGIEAIVSAKNVLAEKTNSPTASSPAPSKPKELGLAEIEIARREEIRVARLAPGVPRLFGRVHARIEAVGEELSGAYLSQAAWQSTPTYDVTVTKPGYLYAIRFFEDTRKATKLEWEERPTAVTGPYIYDVYRTVVSEGQRIRISNLELGLIAGEIEVK
jgi:hypothetical protein